MFASCFFAILRRETTLLRPHPTHEYSILYVQTRAGRRKSLGVNLQSVKRKLQANSYVFLLQNAKFRGATRNFLSASHKFFFVA